MKAKKSSGSTKGKSSGKRAMRDLAPHKAHEVKGGTPAFHPLSPPERRSLAH